MMKIALLSSVCFLLALLKIAASACPHDDGALTPWSKIHADLEDNANVTINSPVLLDKDISVFGIVIEEGGKLVVDPSVAFIDAYYILVAGEFHIGSEDCQFPGKVTINMHGSLKDKYSVDKLTCKKCINVIANGVIEMHGKFKRPWTKLAATFEKVPESAFIHNKESSRKNQDQQENRAGLLIRTFDSKTGLPKDAMSLKFKNPDSKAKGIQKIKDITNDDNDDCVLLAVRKSIMKRDDPTGGNLDGVYDALEKLGYGHITNDLCLRQHTFYDSFAMATCKGDKSLTQSSCGNYRLGDKFKKITQCVVYDNKKFCAMGFSDTSNHGKSIAKFEVTKIEYTHPKMTLAQVPTNWNIGDEVCVTSTDYDWEQYECGTMVECSDCNDNQIKIDLTTRFDHYAKVTKNVDMRAEVFVNTRNVRLTAEMEDFTAEDGGMVKFSEGFKRANVENIEIERFGDSSKIGIYPLHYHMCKEVQGKTYLKNNAIHDSWSRCIVTHGTMGALVDWNTCFFCMGHAYFTEDGGEKNTIFTNNFGLGTLKANNTEFTQLDNFPATYFISNPYTTFTGNVGAGGVSSGIYVIFPDEPTGLSKGLGFMKRDEAKKTPISMDNNAVHSYLVGFRFQKRLNDQNEGAGYNRYQPKDNEGNPSTAEISRLTAYKNRLLNAYVQGGRIKITQSSFADSPIGIEFRRAFNERSGNLHVEKTEDGLKEEPGQKPWLTNSVIIGDSDNKGNPSEGEDRSLPDLDDKEKERCGVMVTSAVWSVDNTWFGGFENSANYKTGAICFKDDDIFTVSPRNTFKNVAFGFEDPTNGNRVYNPVSSDDLESASVGNKVSIFHDEEGKVTSVKNAYVVQSTDFLNSEKSQAILNWDMSVSRENFAQIRVITESKTITMMRCDKKFQSSPSRTASFNVITGNQYHYIMKMSEYDSKLTVGAVGMSSGHSVVIGVCIPPNSKPRVDLHFPEKVQEPVIASSYDDFFKSEDHMYIDSDVGVVLFKMRNTGNFAEDDVDECPKGACSTARVHPEASDQTDLDCFARYEAKYLKKGNEKRKRTAQYDGLHERLARKKRSADPLPSTELNEAWGAKALDLRA